MSKEFVSYDIALALKKLGFDEPCYNQYTDGTLDLPCTKYDYPDCVESIPAPLYQQAFRWFREKGYHAGIIPRYDEFHYFIKDFVNDKEYDDVYNISSYQEAELACLKKLIEIVEIKQR